MRTFYDFSVKKKKKAKLFPLTTIKALFLLKMFLLILHKEWNTFLWNIACPGERARDFTWHDRGPRNTLQGGVSDACSGEDRRRPL